MRKPYAFLSFVLILSSCIMVNPIVEEDVAPILLETVEVEVELLEYQPAETKVNNLQHTRLDIAFDWEKHHLLGAATLDLNPYFYATNRLQLDAKGFDIHQVAIETDSGRFDLEYSYDSRVLDIILDKTYSRIETYRIYVEYTSKPDDLPIGGSDAIVSDRGLYFVNTDSTEVNKPTQIWTQGQTESSSCWFPTIDSPNERTTQEMYISVDEKYKTLSNGELIYSNFNGDGTRTDYWKMDQDHPPYLFMMAVGDFAVTEDFWVNSKGDEIPVNYWVESEYGEFADDIFGATPEMLTFFSEKLNYDYPWQKYSQVVVRDYVSGAMENTTATIHGEFLNATDRDLLDGNNEDIIAHELFHHWFGDLVTCESWANLPLNESFATYGEYLWEEHKRGQDAADLAMMHFRENYFNEALYHPKNLIRYYYDDKEDMFDSHSYEKGACILHMLRRQVGDEAFFLSLNKYLVNHEYQDAEVHNLRLAFESVTGADLQWFFDQWFLGKGHPKLDVGFEYQLIDSTLSPMTITINQTQQDALFRLPLTVEVVFEDRIETFDWLIEEMEFHSTDYVSGKPLWINIDPDHDLLAEISILYSLDQNLQRFAAGGDLFSRLYPLEEIMMAEAIPEDKRVKFNALLLAALCDPHKEVRLAGLDLISNFGTADDRIRQQTNALMDDKETEVAAEAMLTMITAFNQKDEKRYIEALGHRSYRIMAAGLDGLSLLNPQLALARAKALEKEEKPPLIQAVSSLYANHGNPSHDAYFKNIMKNGDSYETYLATMNYSTYLYNQGGATLEEGVTYLEAQMASDEMLASYSARIALSLIQRELSMDLELLEEENVERKASLTTLINKIAAIILTGS